MYYLIDFDTRSVECVSKDKKLLSDYVDKNKLSLAVTLIHTEDELAIQLSIEEVSGLYNGLEDKELKSITEAEIIARTWDALQDHLSSFPKYSIALGKRLIKQANIRLKDTIKDKKPRDKKTTSTNSQTKQAARAKQSSTSILKLGIEPKIGTALGAMYTIVDDNLGEMKFSELVEEYMFNVGAAEKLTRRYINKSIRLGHLEVKDEAE